MNYQTFLWILSIGLLIAFAIAKKKGNKNLNSILFSLLLIIFFGQMLLPRQIFGKWNLISKLNGKIISKIILRPSEPNWQVNLVDKDFFIFERNQIDTLTYLLQKVEIYSASHPMRIWETKMVIFSAANDSLEIQINQTENTGTNIYTPTNEWRKDAIGNYLERLTYFKKPVYSDTSTTKN